MVLGGMAGLAGASQVELAGQGMEQLLFTLTPRMQPLVKNQELGWERSP